MDEVKVLEVGDKCVVDFLEHGSEDSLVEKLVQSGCLRRMASGKMTRFCSVL